MRRADNYRIGIGRTNDPQVWICHDGPGDARVWLGRVDGDPYTVVRPGERFRIPHAYLGTLVVMYDNGLEQ